MNIPGYGPNRVWIPPIKKPDSIIEIFDRFELAAYFSRTLPFIEGVWEWA